VISVADGCIVTAGVISEQRASVAAETCRNMLLTSAVDVPTCTGQPANHASSWDVAEHLVVLRYDVFTRPTTCV